MLTCAGSRHDTLGRNPMPGVIVGNVMVSIYERWRVKTKAFPLLGPG